MKPRHIVLLTILVLTALIGMHRYGASWGLLTTLGTFALGTVTVTQITTGDLPSGDRQSFTVVSTSDTDTQTGAVTHVMGVNPLMVLTPIGAAADLAAWYQVTKSGTQWGLNKSTAAGSGATTATVQVDIIRRR